MTQEQGKAYRRVARRGADLRRHHRLVRRGRPPRLWPHRAGPAEGRAPDRAAGAGRRRRRLHAVEFPDADAGAQDRRRARRRLLDHHQGLGRNAGRLRRAGEMLRRCRPAGGRAQSRVRRAGGSVRAPDRRRRSVQEDFLHRLDPGRQASRRARRQGHEARHHGARRPFAGRGVRRRRSGEGRRHHRRVQVPQRRPGLHLADALLRAGERLQQIPRALHRIRQGHQARRRAGEGHHAWARSPIRAGSTPWSRFVNDAKEPRRQDRRPAASATATRASSSSRR